MAQPMTATQIARKLDVKAFTCMAILRELEHRGLVSCLNREARQNRVFWLTAAGIELQARLRSDRGQGPLTHSIPEIDWALFGFVCFGHRAAIVTALGEPMQAAEIRRKARRRSPGIRMSSNNARDALKLLQQKGIVRRVYVRKKAHPRYELVEACRDFPRLLRQAAWRGTG